MLVEIDFSAADTETEYCTQQDFDKLLKTLTYKDRYKILLKEKSILNAKFVKNAPEKDKEIIKQIYINSINITKKSDCLITGKTNETKKKEFSVVEAVIYFESPLEIVLENCNNDSYFLSAIFRSYKPEFNFENKLNSRWISIIGNGGCQSIKDIIYRQLRSNNDKSKMLRMYIILDSDKRYKSDVVKKYEAEENFFSENNVSYHILEKRCMENYLPTTVFESLRTKLNSNWITAFESLSEDQKDYIDISRGFSSDAGKEADKNIPDRALLDSKNPEESLFLKEVSDTDFNTLWIGLNIKSFKTDFPRAFENKEVSKESFMKRTEHQDNPLELQQIVDEIEALL